MATKKRISLALCVLLAFCASFSLVPIKISYGYAQSNKAVERRIFDISFFEFEDIENNIWHEIRLGLDKNWADNVLQDDQKFFDYATKLLRAVDMVVVQSVNHVDGYLVVHGRAKNSSLTSPLTGKKQQTKRDFFKTYHTFAVDNPFVYYYNTFDVGFGSNILGNLAMAMKDGVHKKSIGVNIGSATQEIGLTLTDIIESNKSYYFHTNYNIKSQNAKEVIMSRQKFLVFENISKEQTSLDVTVVTANTIGYNIIIILAGIASVFVFAYFASKNKKAVQK